MPAVIRWKRAKGRSRLRAKDKIAQVCKYFVDLSQLLQIQVWMYIFLRRTKSNNIHNKDAVALWLVHVARAIHFVSNNRKTSATYLFGLWQNLSTRTKLQKGHRLSSGPDNPAETPFPCTLWLHADNKSWLTIVFRGPNLDKHWNLLQSTSVVAVIYAVSCYSVDCVLSD